MTPHAVTRCLLTAPPRTPPAPVTSTVPSGSHGDSAAVGSPARASRGTRIPPSRKAIWGSPVATAAARPFSDVPSVSTSTNRPGCSACAVRTRPQTAAPARSSTSSSSTPTARRVTTTSGRSSVSSRSSRTRTASNARRRAARTSVSAGSNRTTTGSASTCSGCAGGTSGQSRTNNASGTDTALGSGKGRATRESTEATGAPVGSASSTRVPPSEVGASLTRTAVAPAECSRNPVQENGMDTPVPPDPAASSQDGCRAASSSAGWMPNAPGSPGNVTSANTSSPRRHAAVSPRNTGP